MERCVEHIKAAARHGRRPPRAGQPGWSGGYIRGGVRGFDARDRWTWLGLGVAALLAYLVAGPLPQQIDGFGWLAQALLDGRLHLTLAESGAVEQVPRPEGGWYLPYPPTPALVMLPLVAAFGEFDPGLVGAALGALNVVLLHAILRWLGVGWSTSTWLAVGFGFGSVAWWSAATADVWNLAHTTSMTFAFAALALAVSGRAPLAAGLLLGLAAAARLPVGLTLPLYLALYARVALPPLAGSARVARLREAPGLVMAALRAGRWRPALVFLCGLAVPALLVAGYNVARFGSPIEFGYADIPGVATEPWYTDGVLSIGYIPRHIHVIFIRGFDFLDYQFPWFRPNWMGLSLVISTPVLLWLARARSRATFVAFGWLAVGLALIPIVTHGTVGQVQLGYRFSQDVAPILWLMLGYVFRERMPVEAKAAVVIGVLINAYGIWAIYALEFVSF